MNRAKWIYNFPKSVYHVSIATKIRVIKYENPDHRNDKN